jgi:hypothetical protein
MISPPRSLAKGRSPIGGQRQLQTLVRLQAARSIHGGPRSQLPTALRQPPDRRIPTAAQYARLAFSILERSSREEITEPAWQDSTAELAERYNPWLEQSTVKPHTRDKRLQPNGYAFQLRPAGARGSHEQRQSSRFYPSSTSPPRSTAKGRAPIGGQRQLQTLVRPQAARSIQFRSRSQKPTALR